ncbi:MAG TPA: pilus assembly protein TadG-related protein [Dehalococcoidia bacterium]|nr:pilus assembly protein TadG-related protein [Dehalococcoidia bacterium]
MKLPRVAFRGQSCRESGQTMPMMALMLTALLGFVGLTVDVGSALLDKTSAQGASDAASLAAASELREGNSVEAATAAAHTFAATNGFQHGEDGVSVTVSIPPESGPYAGSSLYAEVSIHGPSEVRFARVVGINLLNIGVRSVAGSALEVIEKAPPRALFALQTGCSATDPFKVSGSDNFIIGGIHSNSTVDTSGSYNLLSEGDNTGVCSLSNGGSGNVFDPSYQNSPELPDPLGYTYSDVPCTRTFTSDTDLTSVNSVWVNDDPNTNQLLPGVYCSTGKLTLSASDVTGTVTLVAQQELSISGSNFNIKPYWNDVLLFTTSSTSSAADLSGSGGTWEGYIYVPNGKAKLNGSGNFSVKGAVIGGNIELSGSGVTVDSTDFTDNTEEILSSVKLFE